MFKKSDLNKFIKDLKGDVEKVQTTAISKLEESLKLVEATSQRYVPIDSYDLTNSFFTNIKVENNRIIAVAGYDENGRLAHYAKIMHEGFWPNDYPNKRIAGTAINYRTDFQPTPQSHFLLKGFKENETEIWRLLGEIFDGV